MLRVAQWDMAPGLIAGEASRKPDAEIATRPAGQLGEHLISIDTVLSRFK